MTVELKSDWFFRRDKLGDFMRLLTKKSRKFVSLRMMHLNLDANKNTKK